MALLEQWQQYAQEQQEGPQGTQFWKDYLQREKEVYQRILESKPRKNTVKGYAEKYGVDLMTMVAFLDGINDSLRQKLNVEDMTEDSEFELDIDLEKLYFNMLDAKADYLYTLPEWDSILSEEKRAEITKSYRRSKTVVKEPKIGRNDPCPCGSGKKYKKCCGKNL